MRRISLLTATLISVLALSACTQKEVVKVDPLAQPIEKSEPTKPALPIVVSIVPDVEEEDENDNIEIDADIDYYGKDEVKQPTPSSPNSGLPTTINPKSGVDYSQGSATAQETGNGIPYTDRAGHYHTGNTVIIPYTGGTC